MFPVIHLPGISIQSYYFFALLAGLTGFILSSLSLRRQDLGLWSMGFPFIAITLALPGARLLNYLTNPEAYSEGFSLWTITYTKLSLMGGLIAGCVGIMLCCMLLRISPGRVFDSFTAPAALGIALLKLGCFCNGCCFGKPSSGAFGMVFPVNAIRYQFIESLPMLHGSSPRVHPTQLYEIAGALIALVIALALGKHFRPGGRAVIFAAAFAAARWAILPLRALPYADWVIQSLYPALYGMTIALSAVLLFLLRRGKS
ncbi:MAG: prolipoprotein diacylglyceryl transferase [Firmicutes bacterium]|nr:prolipoprotein diacylglyceryl transferase [Bacillota bacterium]